MSLRSWLAGLALLVSFCAVSAAQVLSGNSHPAAPAASVADNPEVDCGPDNFTQSVSLAPDSGSLACVTQDANQYHADNSWWRAFDLPVYGLSADFTVCGVNLTVALATTPGAVGQPLTVNLYTNSGCPFPGGTLTPIGTSTVTVADQAAPGNITVAVSGLAPADAELVVEIHVNDGRPVMQTFFTGGNAAGQTKTSWLSSVGCGIPNPTDVGTLADGSFELVMQVIGTEGVYAPTAVVADTAGNGVIDLGETAVVAPTWQNVGTSPTTFGGLASNLTGPGGLTYTLVDGTADYGNIGPGAASNCADTTGDCFSVKIDGSGFGHRDASFDETIVFPNLADVAPPPVRTRLLHVGPSFSDVPTTSLFYKYVETILHNGVTGGCGTDIYCLTNNTLRKQMAVFLLKALDGACYLPPPATGVFADVAVDDPFAPWIEELYNRGITGGCSGGPPPAPISYCPNDLVKRQQMAVFLLKTDLGSGYVPPVATGLFTDVPTASPFAPWIEDLFNRSIAAGCGTQIFCPANAVNRGQMAPFLTKTFGLLLYAP